MKVLSRKATPVDQKRNGTAMAVRVRVLGEPVPTLPFEKDESIDLADVKPRKIMKQAAADIANGSKDTDRGEQMNSTYKRLGRKR